MDLDALSASLSLSRSLAAGALLRAADVDLTLPLSAARSRSVAVRGRAARTFLSQTQRRTSKDRLPVLSLARSLQTTDNSAQDPEPQTFGPRL